MSSTTSGPGAIAEFAAQECERLKAINAELVAALDAFVTAEDKWRHTKGGMPEGTFDDPLSDAYQKAREAIAKAKGQP